jgi:hypothetical protein
MHSLNWSTSPLDKIGMCYPRVRSNIDPQCNPCTRRILERNPGHCCMAGTSCRWYRSSMCRNRKRSIQWLRQLPWRPLKRSPQRMSDIDSDQLRSSRCRCHTKCSLIDQLSLLRNQLDTVGTHPRSSICQPDTCHSLSGLLSCHFPQHMQCNWSCLRSTKCHRDSSGRPKKRWRRTLTNWCQQDSSRKLMKQLRPQLVSTFQGHIAGTQIEQCSGCRYQHHSCCIGSHQTENTFQ